MTNKLDYVRVTLFAVAILSMLVAVIAALF